MIIFPAASFSIIAAMRRWDYAAAQRVHHFIAISTEIQARIKTFYNRDSVVIYPPVDTARFAAARTDEIGDYFLVVSRQIPYKRIDLAVQACTRLGLKLIVGGTGRDLERLREMAGPTIEFRGFIPDEELPGLMARSKATQGCRVVRICGASTKVWSAPMSAAQRRGPRLHLACQCPSQSYRWHSAVGAIG